ncbi:hypothetical protein BGZ63DRAFT_392149 [Mariannaea sp. PMI_226]|nr:hypothetical protein BGZ63DRAFT_392149 [Mariannaea sp. PMI_226]
MVNIAGRSKGCSNCRKRRVKCDEEQPVCRRCQRWNFECDGPRGLTIIQEVIKKPQPKDRQGSRLGLAKRHDASRSGLNSAHASLRPSLRVVGFDVYICYTRENLRRDGFIFTAIQGIRPVDVTLTRSNVPACRISHQAILSLATILFGTQHQQSDILGQGYNMYGDALRQLNQALGDTTRYTSDEVIVAVAVLAVTELLMPSGPENFLPHMSGLERLIALRDPYSFWSQQTPGFREGLRFMILYASLRLRRSSIFAEADWMKAIRANLSEHQIPEQELYDILAFCTVLIAERDVMMANWHLDAAASTQKRNELEEQGHALLAQLHDWKMRWGNNKHLEHYLEIYTTSNSAQGPEGNDFAIVTFMLHKLTLIHVFQILASIPSSNLTTGRVLGDNGSVRITGQFTKEAYLAEKRQAALEACHWVQHYLKGNRSLDMHTSTVVHWTIGMIWRELRNDESTEGNWLRDFMGQKGDKLPRAGYSEHIDD